MLKKEKFDLSVVIFLLHDILDMRKEGGEAKWTDGKLSAHILRIEE